MLQIFGRGMYIDKIEFRGTSWGFEIGTKDRQNTGKKKDMSDRIEKRHTTICTYFVPTFPFCLSIFLRCFSRS